MRAWTMRLEVPRADDAEARREGGANHIAGGGRSNSFQRQYTRFPANFIADQATADQAAGSAAMHYNFCRIHKTLRVTPAMAAGVTERLWEIGDMVKVLEDWENTT